MNQNLQKFGIKFKTFFGIKQEKKNKGATKEFIAKLSRGLMLPIAMLPIAGLFLGIGAAIETNAGNDAGLKLFGNFLKIPGDVIFGALPVLFAIAIAIAFTRDAGPAALSALIGFLVFSGLQSALIQPVSDGREILGYNLLFYGPGSLGEEKFGLPKSLFGSVLGINQLSTSVFGGFIVGFTVAFLYNKFKNIQLPQIIGFFNGVRFIPIVTFTALFPITLLVLMLWPLIGTLFGIIGGALGGQMFGFNSLIFGYIERALVPFGLHHAFYSPLWYSNVGGSLDLNSWAITSDGKFLSVDGTTLARWIDIVKLWNPSFEGSTIAGDQVLWSFANSNLVGKQVYELIHNGSEWSYQSYTIKFTDIAEIKNKLGTLPDAIKNSQNITNGANGVNIGQYMQGKYAFMMFGLPAAAVAMIFAAPKGNRKMAASIIGSAGLTAMLTGITEPIEFTFLFLAPWLFWGVHASLCALSFGMMNWIGLISLNAGHPELAPHIGMSFSGGLIDWIIYGGIQIQYGSNAWWSLLLGLVYVPIYFFLFLYLIKKYNIATPGRGENTKLFTKQDYLNKKSNGVENKSLPNMTQERALAIEIIKAYGGLENIKNVDACITKLRIQVENQDIVNTEILTSELGARGVIKPSAQSVYSIYGALADRLKNEINDIISDIEENPSLKEQYFNNDDNVIKQEIKTIKNEKEISSEKIIIKSPLDGKIIPIEEVPDETFSKSMMGAGVAIEPKNGTLTSPISGKMSLVFDTGHAYTFESKKGTQVLVHIGIDSINLKDENQKELKVFNPKVKTNDSIKMGDNVCSFKLNDIKKYAKSHITPIIVLDESLNGREVKVLKTSGTIIRGEPLLEVLPPKKVSNN